MADFSFTPNGDLKITLDEEDREYIAEMREEGKWGDEVIFLEMIESQRCNGWENIYHIALWGNHINLTEGSPDDNGNFSEDLPVYTFTNYALRSEIDALLEDGYVILTKFE